MSSGKRIAKDGLETGVIRTEAITDLVTIRVDLTLRRDEWATLAQSVERSVLCDVIGLKALGPKEKIMGQIVVQGLRK